LGTASLTSADAILNNEITVFLEAQGVMAYHDQPFYVVSKSDLIAAKRASGGEVDLQDVRVLELKTEGQVDFY